MVVDRKYYQVIPKKVNEALPTLEALIAGEIKGFNPDYLKEVISIVACHVRKNDEATPLKMKYIKKMVPQGDKYLSGLIDIGVIQRSGNASREKHICYNYQFSEEYKSRFLSFPLKNASLILRIEKAFEKKRKEDSKSIRGKSDQVKYLKKLTISDDFDEFINSHFTEGTDQYNSILGSAMRIKNGDIFYTVDNTSGRFHSNLTNLSKDLRPFLRIKGEPLVNIDVKNSQPYLSTIILTNPGKVSHMTNNPAFSLLLQTLQYKDTEDIKKYISLVISGQLYEYLMDEFAKGGIRLNRSETKVQVLRILFARNRAPKEGTNRKAREIFRANFPTVHRIFSKVRGNHRGDRFTSFKRFAILLQRIESFLMLDVILKRIYRELPGVIAVTVHDSIMTGIMTNNVEAVRRIISEELTKFVGFTPQIKIEGLLIKKEMEKERKEKESRDKIILNQYCATNLAIIN